MSIGLSIKFEIHIHIDKKDKDVQPKKEGTTIKSIGLKTGTSGTALVASGNASPHANCSGASRDSSPVDAGA